MFCRFVPEVAVRGEFPYGGVARARTIVVGTPGSRQVPYSVPTGLARQGYRLSLQRAQPAGRPRPAISGRGRSVSIGSRSARVEGPLFRVPSPWVVRQWIPTRLQGRAPWRQLPGSQGAPGSCSPAGGATGCPLIQGRVATFRTGAAAWRPGAARGARVEGRREGCPRADYGAGRGHPGHIRAGRRPSFGVRPQPLFAGDEVIHPFATRGLGLTLRRTRFRPNCVDATNTPLLGGTKQSQDA